MEENESMLDNMLTSDEPIDYTELITQDAFIGDTPLNVILEGIDTQFRNYISTEDREDYVDKFYNQIHASYDAINNDDEDHPQEKREILDKILDTFTSKVSRLFESRLTITIMSIDSEERDADDEEYIIRQLYSYFILDARKTFTNVISKYVSQNIDYTTDDNKFFNDIERSLLGFSPHVIAINPMEFIQYSGNDTIYDLFDNGSVTGNFLRKYSPRLFSNEEFKCELIAEITSRQHVRREILNAKSE